MILFCLGILSSISLMNNSLSASSDDPKLQALNDYVRQVQVTMFSVYAIRKYVETNTIPIDKEGNPIVNYKEKALHALAEIKTVDFIPMIGLCVGDGADVGLDITKGLSEDNVRYVKYTRNDILKTINILLDRSNVEINWQDVTQNNLTTLMHVAKLSDDFLNPDPVTMLLDYGADPALVDADGKTAGDYCKAGKEAFDKYVGDYRRTFASLTTTALCSSGGLPVPVAQLVMQYDPRFKAGHQVKK